MDSLFLGVAEFLHPAPGLGLGPSVQASGRPRPEAPGHAKAVHRGVSRAETTTRLPMATGVSSNGKRSPPIRLIRVRNSFAL